MIIIYRAPNVTRGQKRHGYSGTKKERPEKRKVGSVFNAKNSLGHKSG